MKKEILPIFIILILGFVVRLYRFDSPIADWHAWRQADTSAVSRNFVKHGYDILHPRFDDLSNVASGLDNPNGYRFVEFPIYNIFQAGLYQFIGGFTIEEWGRIVSIVASIISAVFLYLLVKNRSNKTIAILTAFFFLFLPYNIYYSRTILPDSSMVMASLGGIYFFDLWILQNKNKKVHRKSYFDKYLIIACIFTATALLLKPYAAFFTLPMLVMSFEQFRWSILKQWQLYVFILFSFLPLLLWRMWMIQFPQGIPANNWLLNGNGIRFRPAFFRWMLYERLIKLISGFFGIAIVFFGAIGILKMQQAAFFLSFLLASFLYVVIFATGNVQHDYYQILIMPTVAIFYGIGGWYLLHVSLFNKKVPLGKIILIILTVGAIYKSWYFVKDYFNINNPAMVIAGKAANALLPKDAKVIAPLDGDTSFLYQTNRQGWASFEKPLAEMIELGADYLVLTNPTQKDFEGIGREYKVIAYSSEYIIFDLKQKP